MKTLIPLLAAVVVLINSSPGFAAEPKRSGSFKKGSLTRIERTLGTGLAPSTWGVVARYSGTYRGTGYYTRDIDRTYSGLNSLVGYSANYPAAGFIADPRALYVFDVAGLAGLPSPVWSAFLFEPRERPALEDGAGWQMGEMQIVSAGDTHRLEGFAFFLNQGAANFDVYDGEDLETATPFAEPSLVFTGANNSLIGTIPVVTDVIVPIDFDVSSAVLNDLAGAPTTIEVPTLNRWSLIFLALVLAGLGAFALRR